MAKRVLCLILVAWLGASCDLQKLMKDMTPAQDLALASQCFELLRKHDVAMLEHFAVANVPGVERRSSRPYFAALLRREDTAGGGADAASHRANAHTTKLR